MQMRTVYSGLVAPVGVLLMVHYQAHSLMPLGWEDEATHPSASVVTVHF